MGMLCLKIVTLILCVCVCVCVCACVRVKTAESYGYKLCKIKLYFAAEISVRMFAMLRNNA